MDMTICLASDAIVLTDQWCSSIQYFTIDTVCVTCVSLQGGVDSTHDVDRGEGEWHPVAAQSLTKPLRLIPQLLQLVSVLMYKQKEDS